MGWYVLPLTAISKGSDGLMRVLRPVAGRIPTSAAVSTRNCLPEILSHTKRRLSLRLVTKATVDDLTCTFPCHGQDAGSDGLNLQMCDDSSIAGQIKWWEWLPSSVFVVGTTVGHCY